MFKKINKKFFFRVSFFISSLLALIASSKSDNALISGLVDSIPPVSSLAKVEKAYAFGAGDCCGSCGCDGYSPTYEIILPQPTSSAVILWFSTPSQTVTSNVRPYVEPSTCRRCPPK